MIYSNSHASVLIAADEAALALDLAGTLEAEGYTVVGAAANGPQALELFRQHPVDLLLCAIGLLGPWDGIETARRLTAERPVPLIYLTALTDQDTLTRALPTAPAAYLTKPVNVATLRAAVVLALRAVKPATKALLALPPVERGNEANTREIILHFDHYVFLKHNYRFVRLILHDIILLKADNTVVTLVTTGTHFSLRMSLKTALKRLNYPPLVRVHRSFAINLQHVSSFSEVEANLHNQTVPLGRQYKADFLRQFQQY